MNKQTAKALSISTLAALFRTANGGNRDMILVVLKPFVFSMVVILSGCSVVQPPAFDRQTRFPSAIQPNLDEGAILRSANKALNEVKGYHKPVNLMILPTVNHVDGMHAGLPLFGNKGDSYAFTIATGLLAGTNIRAKWHASPECSEHSTDLMLETGVRSYDADIESSFKGFEAYTELPVDSSIERGNGFKVDRFMYYVRLVKCSNGSKRGIYSFTELVYAVSVKNQKSMFIMPKVLGFFYNERSSSQDGLGRQSDLSTVYLVSQALVDSFIAHGFFENNIIGASKYQIEKVSRDEYQLSGEGLLAFNSKWVKVSVESFSGKIRSKEERLTGSIVRVSPENMHAVKRIHLQLVLGGVVRAAKWFDYSKL